MIFLYTEVSGTYSQCKNNIECIFEISDIRFCAELTKGQICKLTLLSSSVYRVRFELPLHC